MDAGLSFIMTNHAKVKENDLVFDPFVGTGSLLVACSHFGAYVCGTDIDYNTIHGKGRSSRKNQKWRGPDENIRANLRQYGTQKMYVDVMVSDASKPVWRNAALFDAIITDPPYGIRESTRKTGSHKDITKAPDGSYAGVCVCVLTGDSVKDRIWTGSDIFTLADKRGRMMLRHSSVRSSLNRYCEEMIPHHACLQLVSNCEQMLSSHTSRRLITMEKIKDPKELDGLAGAPDPRCSPYHGHNAFREKYFSGLNKRSSKEDTRADVDGK
uniref:tRNA (guanine(10)-N(2))-methyltransferase TRMT11 n=1 Tax=Nothobranchius kuhntae TaxID=321403 RepID=A0A1A8ITF8_NOTKU